MAESGSEFEDLSRAGRARWSGRVLPTVAALALSVLPSQASQLRFDRLSIDDGLSQSVVLCIAQDHDGFLWIGTQDGLNRYDGLSFSVLRHDPDDPSSLSSSYIRALLADRQGQLWIGTSHGLNRLDPRTGRLDRFFRDPADGHSGHDTVLSLAEGRDGLWLGTEDGLVFFDPTTGRFQVERPDPGTGELGEVLALWPSSEGGLWLGTRGGGAVRRSSDGSFRWFRADPPSAAAIAGNVVWAITEDDRGRVLLGTNGGLSVLGQDLAVEPRGDGPTLDGPDAPLINALLHDRSGRLWIGTEGGGVGLYDESGLRYFRQAAGETSSLSNDFVNTLFEDRSGNVWIGTWAGGLDKYAPFKHKFDRYSDGPDDTRHLGSGEVYALAEEGAGVVWVGTREGLERFDAATETFERITHEPANPASLSNEWVYAVLIDRGGDLWVGTYEGGLNLRRRGEKTFQVFRHDPSDPGSLSHDIVNWLTEDVDGDLWVSTAEGLNHLDRDTGRFVRYRHDPDDPASLSHDGALVTLLDRKGRLWIGTDGGGLDLFERETRTFRHVTAEVATAAVVLCLLEDRHGRIWLGTDGGGLHRLDPETGAILRLAEKNGLPNNVVYGLVEDDDGKLWLSTNLGLARLDPVTQSVRTYDVHDGLQSNEFNQGAYHRGASGTVYFGGIHGFNRFRPSEVRDNPTPPPVAVTGLRIDNRPSAVGSLRTGSELTLSPDQSVFSFEFAALDFTLPERNRYAYRMEGFDENWIDAGHRRFATYTNLDPGSYTFRVRAANSDGIWNTEGVSIRMTLAPAFWQTAWFRLLAVALAVLAVVGVYRARVRRIERQKHRLETEVAARTAELRRRTSELAELNEKKNEFLGIATHELRQPLNVLLGYVEYVVAGLEKGHLNQETALKCLRRSRKAVIDMNAMVSSLLDISAIESGKIDLAIEGVDMIAILEECLEHHLRRAEEKEITLKLERNKVPEIIVDRSRIVEVVDNLLSNALKYTYPGGSIHVTCETTDGEIVTHVRDTGQGLSPADLDVVFTEFRTLSARPTGGETSTGFGLAIVKKIVDLHGGRIWVESRQGDGARFSFALPLNDA